MLTAVVKALPEEWRHGIVRRCLVFARAVAPEGDRAGQATVEGVTALLIRLTQIAARDTPEEYAAEQRGMRDYYSFKESSPPEGVPNYVSAAYHRGYDRARREYR